MPRTYFKRGSWNGLCDVCGFKFKFTELQKRWDNLIVCHKDFEQDHPQKYIRVRESGLSVPVIRDRPEDVFVQTCSIWTSSPMADFGTADCATVGGNTNIPLLVDLFRPQTSSIANIAISNYSITGVI